MGAFFVFWLVSLPALALCSLEGLAEWVEVASVVDGDTLRLADGRRVRLIGLDAPELGRKGRSDEPYARAAQDYLRKLVAGNGGQVGLHPGEQSHDRHGRLLAHAYDRAGTNVEAALLVEGLGRFVAVAPNTALVECHQHAEARARRALKGVWRSQRTLTPEQLTTGGFALVEVRIERIERNRGGIWLETGSSLVLNIPPGREQAFDLQALNALRGARVEARGWVIDRKRGQAGARWLLPVSHPAMLSPLP